MPFAATWMDLEMIILSEVSHAKTNVWYRLLWNLNKQDTNELLYKTEIDSHRRKQTYGYQRERGGRDKLGVRD